MCSFVYSLIMRLSVYHVILCLSAVEDEDENARASVFRWANVDTVRVLK